MLGKLIKHEFRATGRIMLPLLGAVLVLSPIAGTIMRALDRGQLKNVFRFLGGAVVALFFMAVAAVFIISLALMVRRFYSNLLQDEGYLMFTLPVSTHSLIWSKLIVSFVWFVVASVSSVIFIAVVTVISYAGADFSVAISFSRELTRLVGGWNIAAYILEGIICLFLLSCSVCLHFYAAIALGYSFANHKTLLSVCFYVILSIVMTWLMFMAFGLVGDSVMGCITEIIDVWMNGIKEARNYAIIPHVLFLAADIYFLIVSALYYIPTVLPLKKSLNIN